MFAAVLIDSIPLPNCGEARVLSQDADRAGVEREMHPSLRLEIQVLRCEYAEEVAVGEE